MTIVDVSDIIAYKTQESPMSKTKHPLRPGWCMVALSHQDLNVVRKLAVEKEGGLRKA